MSEDSMSQFSQSDLMDAFLELDNELVEENAPQESSTSNSPNQDVSQDTVDTNTTSNDHKHDQNKDRELTHELSDDKDHTLSTPTNEEDLTWQERYTQLQSLKDKQLAEAEAERRALRSLLDQAASVQLAHPQHQTQPVVMPSDDEVRQGVANAPIDTFTWAVDNAPQLVPTVIAEIRDQHGNHVADRAMFAYNQFVQNEREARMIQAQREREAPMMIANMFSSAANAVSSKYGEDFESVKEEVAKRIQESNPISNWADPNHISTAIENVYLNIKNEQLSTQMKMPQEIPATESFVETGTPGAPPSTEQSPEDYEADLIVKAFQSGRYRG